MEKKKVLIKTLFYSSRISNALILGFVLFFLGAHIIEDLFGEVENQSGGFTDPVEMLMFFCFPIMTCVGLILAWKNEFLGGLISFASIFALMGLQGHLLDELIFWIISLPGFLHLLHSQLKPKVS